MIEETEDIVNNKLKQRKAYNKKKNINNTENNENQEIKESNNKKQNKEEINANNLDMNKVQTKFFKTIGKEALKNIPKSNHWNNSNFASAN